MVFILLPFRSALIFSVYSGRPHTRVTYIHCLSLATKSKKIPSSLSLCFLEARSVVGYTLCILICSSPRLMVLEPGVYDFTARKTPHKMRGAHTGGRTSSNCRERQRTSTTLGNPEGFSRTVPLGSDSRKCRHWRRGSRCCFGRLQAAQRLCDACLRSGQEGQAACTYM